MRGRSIQKYIGVESKVWGMEGDLLDQIRLIDFWSDDVRFYYYVLKLFFVSFSYINIVRVWVEVMRIIFFRWFFFFIVLRKLQRFKVENFRVGF